MVKAELTEIVLDLIELGREGGYWDFKEYWHENKAELLLDIICMANNMEDKDAYIIFGVKDQTMSLVGVNNDANRRDLSGLSQFISTKDFALYIPEIDLQTIEIENYEIDVLKIKNTNRTPYFLRNDFSYSGVIVRKGNIYVRLNDAKAGTDVVAPLACIEHLWKKRFGINLSIMERLHIRLSEYDCWVQDWGNKKYAYHKNFPEFRLQLVGEFSECWWPLAAFYSNPKMYFSKLNIMYHNTIIYETEIWAIDEFRRYIPKATSSTITGKPDNWYSFYDLNSIEGKLFTIFTNGNNDISSRGWGNSNQVLIFDNLGHKEEFDVYLTEHFDDYSDDDIQREFSFEIKNDSHENGGGLKYSAFQVAKVGKIYSRWLQTIKLNQQEP